MEQAIEELYSVFGDFPKPTVIEGCPCCINEKGVDVLLTTPLRDIKPDQLTNYAASALLTIGSAEDYKYFLPRILEINATDWGWWPDPEVIAIAIKKAGFNDWSSRYQMPVIRYYRVGLNRDDVPPWVIDSWMCSIGRLFPDVTSFLEDLESHPTKLVEYYESNSESLIKGRLRNAFWDSESAETYQQIITWFGSEKIQAVIKQHYGI